MYLESATLSTMENRSNTTGHAIDTTTDQISTSTTPYPKVPLPILRVSNFISVVAILLNIMHLIFLSFKPKSRRPKAENFKVFLMVLAVVDILMMTGQLALDHEVVQEKVHKHHWSCVLNATILHSLFVFDLVILFLMSMERLLSVCLPKTFNTSVRKKVYAIFLLCIYVSIQFLYCILAILYHDKAYSVKGSGVCSPGSKQMPQLNNVTLGFGLMCLVFIVISSLVLVCKTCHMVRTATSLPIASRIRTAKQTKLMAYMIAALVGAKVICWVPGFVAVTLRHTKYHSQDLDNIGRMMVYLFSIFAPLIYGATNKEYREYIWRTLTSIQIQIQVHPGGNPPRNNTGHGTVSTSGTSNQQAREKTQRRHTTAQGDLKLL